MPIKVNIAGTWTLVKDVYLKQAGVWDLVDIVYSKVAGTWTIVHASEAVAVVAANVENLDVKSLFSLPDWENSGKKKKVIINAGVIVGSLSATAALLTGTGRANILTIENNGEIQGKGGAANSGAGGPAINVQQEGVTIVNNGAIRGGGGGGGKGGTGGGGSYGTTVYEPSSGWYEIINSYWVKELKNNSQNTWVWGGSGVATTFGATTTVTVGAVTYYRGSRFNYDGVYNYYGIRRTYPSTVNTNGGAGGAGGRGQGYDGALAAGAAGANGGTNAGKGGTGGTGSSWGVAGANGAAGANGNRTNGSAGAAGGAAGAAITGVARTVTGSGTINGAT